MLLYAKAARHHSRVVLSGTQENAKRNDCQGDMLALPPHELCSCAVSNRIDPLRVYCVVCTCVCVCVAQVQNRLDKVDTKMNSLTEMILNIDAKIGGSANSTHTIAKGDHDGDSSIA